jgi:hypothetical protein
MLLLQMASQYRSHDVLAKLHQILYPVYEGSSTRHNMHAESASAAYARAFFPEHTFLACPRVEIWG